MNQVEVLILIQHQILVTDLQDVLQSEGRINNQILGLKGLGGNYIVAYCSKKCFLSLRCLPVNHLHPLLFLLSWQ